MTVQASTYDSSLFRTSGRGWVIQISLDCRVKPAAPDATRYLLQVRLTQLAGAWLQALTMRWYDSWQKLQPMNCCLRHGPQLSRTDVRCKCSIGGHALTKKKFSRSPEASSLSCAYRHCVRSSSLGQAHVARPHVATARLRDLDLGVILTQQHVPSRRR